MSTTTTLTFEPKLYTEVIYERLPKMFSCFIPSNMAVMDYNSF